MLRFPPSLLAATSVCTAQCSLDSFRQWNTTCEFYCHYSEDQLIGDHDMLTPYVGTQDWIRSLNYSIINKWRPWMILDQVAGYTTTYANKMTFATVKGGGHTLDYKPEENSILFGNSSRTVFATLQFAL